MSPGGVFLVALGCAVSFVVIATLLTARRGGRGPGDPPASHPRIDPAGFPVLSTPQPVRFRSSRSEPRSSGPASHRSLQPPPRRAAAG